MTLNQTLRHIGLTYFWDQKQKNFRLYKWTDSHLKRLIEISFTPSLGVTYQTDVETNDDPDGPTLYLGLIFFRLYISLPFNHVVKETRDQYLGHDDVVTWGFTLFSEFGWKHPLDTIIFLYTGRLDTGHGDNVKLIRLFPDLTRCEDYKQKLDGKYKFFFTPRENDEEVQSVLADITIEYSVYRRLKWLPIESHFLNLWIDFYKPTGSNLDSWKGGILGTGIQLNEKRFRLATQPYLKHHDRLTFEQMQCLGRRNNDGHLILPDDENNRLIEELDKHLNSGLMFQ